jgi:CHASE2 domain-containing sensor protein
MARRLLLALLVLVAMLYPLFAAPLAPIEQILDGALQPLRDRAFRRPAAVVIVELRTSDKPWPMDRATLAALAESAVSKGAVAVGIEVDMSHPTERAADAALLEVLTRIPRIVPLSSPEMGSYSDDPLGFVFNRSGALIGVQCSDGAQPFALRVAMMAGASRHSTQERCVNNLLLPYFSQSESMFRAISVAELRGVGSPTAFQSQVVLLGTNDPITRVETYSGSSTTSVANASLIDAALTDSWRAPKLLVTLITYAVFICGLEVLTRRSRSGWSVIVGHASLLIAIALFRTWEWIPMLPAALMAVLNAIWIRQSTRRD